MQSTLTSLQNRRYSFIFRALFGKQPPLHSPPKIRSSISVNFHLPISPLLVHKFILTSPTNASFLYTSPIFDFSIFAYYHPNNLNQKCFPHLSYLANSGCVEDQGARIFCEDWHCFDVSILPQSMYSDNRTHNHWFLIAQVQKIGVLQVVVSDEGASNRNDKPFNPPFLIPPTYCHYLHTLLIPSQKLTFLWKPVTWLDFLM